MLRRLLRHPMPSNASRNTIRRLATTHPHHRGDTIPRPQDTMLLRPLTHLVAPSCRDRYGALGVAQPEVL